MASSRVAAPNRPNLSITSPLLNAKFFISKDAAWPSIPFQTDANLEKGEHLAWEWSIEWRHFAVRGSVQTTTSFWDAQSSIANYGGALTVVVHRGNVCTATSAVQLLGAQPEHSDVSAFLQTCSGSSGFDQILNHESRLQHFDSGGSPVCSLDGGYGIAQLTNPAPTFEQVWNWKLNIGAGLRLFAQKRAEATAYLSRHGSFTDSQLLHETVSRWNGGSYHLWDAQRGWIRKPTILCDSQTGNIGWDMTKAPNQGKTEQLLHARDAACYSRPPRGADAWGYFGVCYADAVLGSPGSQGKQS